MIVKDQIKTIELAHNISSKIIKEISQDVMNNIPEDEPAEYVYLMIHTVANILYKSIHILSGYAETYAIPNSNTENIQNLINFVLKEYFILNKNL